MTRREASKTARAIAAFAARHCHTVARTVRHFGRDQRGVGAIEFALLFPILLFAYLSALEMTLAFSVQKRATSAASTVADLVSQKDDVSKSYLTSMVDVSKSLFVPYGTTGMVLTVTGIKIDSSSKASVLWSWKSDSGTPPYAAGSSVAVDSAMRNADTFLIHSEISIPHELVTYVPTFSSSGATTITISRDYYFRQRVENSSKTITCSDC